MRRDRLGSQPWLTEHVLFPERFGEERGAIDAPAFACMRVPKWVPNSSVLAGLARTDRTATWTNPLLLGLYGHFRTESVGLFIRRFWVQSQGVHHTQGR